MNLYQKIISIFKEYWFTIFIYISFLLILVLLFIFNKNEKTKEHLQILEKNYNIQYDTTYKNFKILSQNTFYGIINKPQIYNYLKNSINASKEKQKINRDKLYNEFIADYERLREFNIEQVHFHFSDSTSFLRMHRPEKFGDNLSSTRYSVVKANKILKPVEGFEIGNIIHGFRFVYPLFDSSLFHIGSVEVSISANLFENFYELNHNADIHFLVSKDICKRKMYPNEYNKFLVSNENNDYLYNETSKEEMYHFTNNNFYSKKELATIKNKMSASEEFIIKKYSDGNPLIIYFKPIMDVKGVPNSAYIVIYTNSEYLKQLDKNILMLNLILVLVSILFFIYLYFEHDKLMKTREKEKYLEQRTKLASMGEMISNIAHQWRQPLSVISTSASGIKLQKEFGVLDDESFTKSVDTIVNQTKYLSQTIEDFRSFFQEKQERKPFKIGSIIDKSVFIFNESIKKKNINLIKNITDIEIISYPEDLKQVIIILLKNSIELVEDNGVIIIDVKQLSDEEIEISIKDSGGGIKGGNINKIFEPYFTTKHKSVGTGVGLYMCHEIITRSFNGRIKVENVNFVFNFKTYIGAKFTINLQKEKL